MPPGPNWPWLTAAAASTMDPVPGSGRSGSGAHRFAPSMKAFAYPQGSKKPPPSSVSPGSLDSHDIVTLTVSTAQPVRQHPGRLLGPRSHGICCDYCSTATGLVLIISPRRQGLPDVRAAVPVCAAVVTRLRCVR